MLAGVAEGEHRRTYVGVVKEERGREWETGERGRQT